MVKRIGIVLVLVAAAAGAVREPPLQGLPMFSGVAFAATQENGEPCPPECVTDSMEIVTWYPSPYNEYEELRLYPISVSNSECNDYNRGLMYYDRDDDKIRVCKGTLLDWQELGYWQLSGTDDIYNTNSGNVGIGTGTTSPLSKLDIRGAKAKTAFAPFENILNLASTESINPLTLRAGIKTAVNPTNRYGAIEVDDAETRRDLVLQPTAGNVGIGTTSPLSKLDIRGIKAKAESPPFFENILNLASTDSINPLTMRAGIKTAAIAENRYGAIEVDDAGTKRDLVLQPTAGNVGIGTTNPGLGAKLEVAGTVRIADGTQGEGKVLTSNADGVASWQPSSGVQPGTKLCIGSAGGDNWFFMSPVPSTWTIANCQASMGFGGRYQLACIWEDSISKGTTNSGPPPLLIVVGNCLVRA